MAISKIWFAKKFVFLDKKDINKENINKKNISKEDIKNVKLRKANRKPKDNHQYIKLDSGYATNSQHVKIKNLGNLNL